MATISRSRSPVAGNCAWTTSPRLHPLSCACSSKTASVFGGDRSAIDPLRTPASDTAGNVVGSIPDKKAFPPSTLASAWRTCETVATPGTARTSSAADVLNPVNVGDVRMKSARGGRWGPADVDALAEAPKTATNTTRPRPIISADAVAAVRRGLRIAFSRASLPGTPSARTGTPIVAATGLAISGVSIAMPMNVNATPAPTSWSALSGVPNSPYTRRPTPTASTMAPLTSRNRSDRPGRSCASRSASIGAIRAARRAGTTAATTVMIVPTTMETITVRSWITVPDEGRSMPSEDSAPFRPMAIPMPKTIPMAEAATPTMNASATTVASTERPEQRELSGPLRDDDRECVEDDERANEQGDVGEYQEGRPEVPQAFRNLILLFGDHGRCGDRLDPIGDRGGDAVGERGARFPLVGDDGDRVELTFLAQEPLRGGEVEQRERRTEQAPAIAVPGDPDDLELTRWPLEQNLHSVADADVVALSRS